MCKKKHPRSCKHAVPCCSGCCCYGPTVVSRVLPDKGRFLIVLCVVCCDGRVRLDSAAHLDHSRYSCWLESTSACYRGGRVLSAQEGWQRRGSGCRKRIWRARSLYLRPARGCPQVGNRARLCVWSAAALCSLSHRRAEAESSRAKHSESSYFVLTRGSRE